jgi:hypothetical protein
VRTPVLGPGAYRLVASATVDGQALAASDSLVALAPKLGEPQPWLGVQDVVNADGVDALLRLRIGRVRGAARPEFDPAAALRLLGTFIRNGVLATGLLPAPTETNAAQAAAAFARQHGRLVGLWELLPAGLGGVPPAAETRRAIYTAVKAVHAKAQVVTAQVAGGDPDAGARLADVIGGEVSGRTDAVQVVLDGPPELAGGVGLPALVRDLRELGGDLPVGVVCPWAPVAPWDLDRTAVPAGSVALGRIDPLTQASLLARTLLLARAAGAAWVVHPGAPAGGPPTSYSVAEAGAAAHLYDYAGAALPAIAAMDQASDHLRGRARPEPVLLGEGVTAYLWQGRRPLLTVWQLQEPGAAATLTLPLAPRLALASDLFGRPVRSSSPTAVRLAVGPHPLYLEAARGADDAFVAAARQAHVDGLPLVDAAVVPSGLGLGVRLRNLGNRPLVGLVTLTMPGAGGPPQPFAALAPGAQITVPGALDGPLAQGTTPARLTIEGAARTLTQTLSVAHYPCRPEAPAPEPLWRLHAGEAAEPADLEAAFTATWDIAALEVRFDVTDDEVTEGDAVELLLHPRLAEQVLDPRAAAGTERLVVRAVDGAIAGRLRASAETEPRPGGYRVTVRVPWQWLGGPPEAGRAVGFDAGVMDTDGATLQSHLRWRGSADTEREPRELGWLVVAPGPR